MDLVHQYISRSWKIITANFIAIVYSPMKLQTVYLIVICQIHRGKYWWIKKISMEQHIIFLSVICYIHRWKYHIIKRVNFLFSMLLLLVNLSVKLLPMDSLAHHKLVTRVFSTEYCRLWSHRENLCLRTMNMNTDRKFHW